MSATGRGGAREPHDFYATPAWCVHRLLERVTLPAGRWLDPCAGSGAIIHAAQCVRTDVGWSAIELRPECDRALERLVGRRRMIADYLRAPPPRPRPEVIITNPPYSLAQDFLLKALSEADRVVMLLRLNYLGSEKRASFFHETPPDVYVLPNRPSFAKGHTDSCEYGWLIWGPIRRRAGGMVSVLGVTPLRERERYRVLRPAALSDSTSA